jgi:glycine/D-amino acid oxidase-like deaminating enzyme
MIRTLIFDPDEQALALASATEIAGLDHGSAYRATGSVILADGMQRRVLRGAAERSRAAGRSVTDSARATGPVAEWLDGAPYAEAFHTAEDGVADIHALLHLYLGEATAGGAELRTGVEVHRILMQNDRVAGLETSAGPIEADVVVNAAGAWAGVLGEVGAAHVIGIQPRRRHLFSTGPVTGADPTLPYVWNDSAGYYFRPESGGFLLSDCDETPAPPVEPTVQPDAEAWLAEKLVHCVPKLADLPVRRRWACLRTFSRDDLFVIGWDPFCPGLYWVAALDGHGVTVSAAVGALAAREILAGEDARNPLSPHRFLV